MAKHRMFRGLRFSVLLGLLFTGCVHSASASVTVLVGEPFGSFGTMMPTGHTTIYLDRVCADGPLKLRMCRPGEPAGVAIARLDAIGGVDWLASPMMDFLYGVDDTQEILTEPTQAEVDALRERYRHASMQNVLPDGKEFTKPNKDWWETVAISYNRRMWGYQLATTREQDEAFVAKINAEKNVHDYHLHGRNCADFAADVVNFYYPGSVKVNRVADFDLMTPKQVARCVSKYGHKHPEAELKILELPQVPGPIARSRPVRGGSEMLLKTKRYLFTLCVIQPEAVAGLAVMYLDRGRWDLGRGYEVEGPEAFAKVEDVIVASK